MKQKWIQEALSKLKQGAPSGIVDITARKLETFEAMKKSIDNEGHVVRDLSGKIVPHPAIKILEETEKQLLDIYSRYGEKMR